MAWLRLGPLIKSYCKSILPVRTSLAYGYADYHKLVIEFSDLGDMH